MKIDESEEIYRETYETELKRSTKYEAEIILLNNKLTGKEKEIEELRTNTKL